MSTFNRPYAFGIIVGFLLTSVGVRDAAAQSTTPYHGTTQYHGTTVTSTTNYQGAATSVDTGEPVSYGGESSDYHERELPIWTIGYSAALGVGDLNDYISNASWRGFDVTLLWPVTKGLFLGLGFGYNGFYEKKPNETRQLSDSAAVTARAYNYTNAWPLSGIVRYVFLQPRSAVRPYLGVRAGVTLMDSTSLVTDRSYNDSSAGFLLAPEVGLLAHLSKSVMLSFQYAFNFSTASTIGGDSLSYNNLILGLALQP